MRQAQESEIIRLSMHVREGKPLYQFNCKNEEVMIVNKEDVTNSMLLWADEVLCATNKTCTQLNNQMRQALGFSGIPQIGDKVINRHNEWDISSTTGNPLTNGIIGQIVNKVEDTNMVYPGFIRKLNNNFQVPVLNFDITGDETDEYFYSLMVDRNLFLGQEENLNDREKYIISHKLKQEIPLTFTFGYAITVWKAQGSQYPKVLLFNENWPKDLRLKKQYLYSGITRAEDKLVVVK